MSAPETPPPPEVAPRSTPDAVPQSVPDSVPPSVETGPQNPAPVKEVTLPVVESTPLEHATNQAEVSTPGEILAERSRVDLAAALERLHGYQPKMVPELEKLVTSPVEGQPIMHHLYAEMIKAYDTGQFNLPAARAEYVNHNPTALFSFIEESAKELTNNKMSAIFGGSDSLGLSPEEWRALGFSSGDPQLISPADKIQTGKLIKLILENAAEDMNSKFKP
jgi:hypothetical protein